MYCFANRHLLIASTVIAPPSVLRFSLNAGSEDIRESVCRMSPNLFEVNRRVDQLGVQCISGSDNITMAKHAPNGFRRDGSQTLIKVIRVWRDHTEVVGDLTKKETIDRLYRRGE